MHLRHNDYMSITSFVFLVIGVAHLWRALSSIPVNFGDTAIPVSVSWVVGLLALYLAYSGYKTRH
jgi:hypothetical protein